VWTHGPLPPKGPAFCAEPVKEQAHAIFPQLAALNYCPLLSLDRSLLSLDLTRHLQGDLTPVGRDVGTFTLAGLFVPRNKEQKQRRMTEHQDQSQTMTEAQPYVDQSQTMTEAQPYVHFLILSKSFS
jgi:hypothetical protein